MKPPASRRSRVAGAGPVGAWRMGLISSPALPRTEDFGALAMTRRFSDAARPAGPSAKPAPAPTPTAVRRRHRQQQRRRHLQLRHERHVQRTRARRPCAAARCSRSGACFTNNTGAPVTALDIAYIGEQWRLGLAGRRADRLDFQYSLDATSLADRHVDRCRRARFRCADRHWHGRRARRQPGRQPHDPGQHARISCRCPPAPPSGCAGPTSTPAADDGLAIDDFSLAVHGGAGAPPVLRSTTASADRRRRRQHVVFFSFSPSTSRPAPTASSSSTRPHDGTRQRGRATTSHVSFDRHHSRRRQRRSSCRHRCGRRHRDRSRRNLHPRRRSTSPAPTVGDGQGQGTIVNDDVVVSAIHDIQGNGATSPLGEPVRDHRAASSPGARATASSCRPAMRTPMPTRRPPKACSCSPAARRRPPPPSATACASTAP